MNANKIKSASARNDYRVTTASADIKYPKKRIIQHFLLIWLDADIDLANEECQTTLTQLQNVVNNVKIFTELDKCVDFINKVEEMTIFLVVGSSLGQQIIPLIHNIPQLDAVYIFSHNKFKNIENGRKQWIKIKGVYIEIAPIYESLQQAVKSCNQSSIVVSFVGMNEEFFSQNLDQLEASFMYTQIFKEILLSMEYNERSIKDFITYCRQR